MSLRNIKKYLNSYNKFVKQNKYARLMRLDKPVGIYLTLLPALWALGFGAQNLFQLIGYSLVFTLGAVSMRSAGCVINDMLDMRFDALVIRTKNRPMVSGEVTLKEAQFLIGGLLLISLFTLTLLPKTAVVIGIFFVVPVFLYPLMKRITFYPQVFLGFVWNAGALIGWYTVQSGFTYPPILIYMSAIFWTVGYDTIYGHQDRIDDIKIGVKSLSIKMGEKTPYLIWNLYVGVVIMLSIVGFMCQMNILFFLMMAFVLYLFYWQATTLKINDPLDCSDKFQSNVKIGLLILVGILLGKM